MMRRDRTHKLPKVKARLPRRPRFHVLRFGIIDNGQMLVEGQTAVLLERFQMVDCTVGDAAPARLWEGARLQEQRGDRWRILLDTNHGGPDRLESLGMTHITTAPVTLEELLVALVKED